MSEHQATVEWKNTSENFLSGKYSREHRWTFDGGIEVLASPSPSVVRPPFSNPNAVDPEEALVAAAASCHMLTFLYVACRQGFLVESYEDTAVGEMTKNAQGVPWISTIRLKPRIVFGGSKQPTAEELDKLHHLAHEQCFIAQSIKSDVVVEK